MTDVAEEAAPLVCPDCGGAMYLSEPTRKGYRSRWLCERYPYCKGAHAADRHGKPMGIPGDAATRAARIDAHAALERIELMIGKAGAYKWLAIVLHLPAIECHISRFDEEMCKKTIGAVNTFTRGKG